MAIKNTRFAVDCDKMTTNERTSSQLRDGVIVYDTDLNAYYKVVNGVWVVEPTSASDTGWAQYSDSVYSAGSPLVINQGNSATLTNNANATITSQLPVDITALWDSSNNKITPKNSGDGYTLRVDFMAFTSVTEGYAVINLDIGGSQGVIQSIPVQFPRGSGSGNTRSFSDTVMFYSLGTFVANGGTLTVEAVRGNISIYDIRFVISRFHKAI
jgi:hypothetical protein